MSDGCPIHPAEHFVRDLLHVSFAAIVGVLTRIGLSLLFGPRHAGVTDESSALFPDLPPNAFGCFLIGFHNEFKQDMHYISPSFALGLSTGYFGSVTTFASWIYHSTKLIASGLWVSAIFSLFIGFAVAVLSFCIGRDVARSVAGILSSGRERMREVDAGPKVSDRRALLMSITLLLIIIPPLLVYAVIEDDPVTQTYFVSALLGPFGAIIRWQLTRLNNTRPTFPFGTFTANILAVTIDVAIGAGLILKESNGGVILQGVITGAAGSLSTVSTWVSEVYAMETAALKWRYVLASLGASQLIGIMVYGITYWVVA